MEKPSLPKGTRDFGPAQMAKRQFIFDNIKKVFQKYGFLPLETPAMENLSTLTGKYGEEGDQLLFKILESGDFIRPVQLKILGIDSQNFSQQLIRNLKVLREKSAQLFNLAYERKDDPLTYDMIKTLWNELDLSIFGGTSELSEEEEDILKIFDKSIADEISSSIYNAIHKIGLSQIQTDDNDFYFSLFEKSYLNDGLSIRLREFLLNELSTKDTKENIINLKSKEIVKELAEKGLRYDLTVPFARYVVMNRHEITFPFKRYQIQPVWRADRPQKGRYREFYQCDADVVGTDSLICEAEIILMIKEVFKALSISDYTIKINHRGVLSGLAELADAKENQMSLFVAIDKLDKIGEEKVKEELIARGFNSNNLQSIFEILNYKGSTDEKLNLITEKISASSNATKAIHDLKAVFQLLSAYGESLDHVEFDIALARGLSYYTGCIFEVKINNVAIGSVSGGGRYDNLTGVFDSKDKNSGVGISFGVDRIYDAMEELKLFPHETQVSSKVLVCHFDEDCKQYGLKVLQSLRKKGIASEIYPDAVKIQKQLDYANKKMIPYTIVIGSDEMKNEILAFKDMKKGEQSKLSLEEIINSLIG